MPEQKPATERYSATGKLLFVIFIFFTLLYSASARPYLGSNDGSQFALAGSLAREHRFAINSYLEYTAYWDYAFRNGNYFSERAPGLSFLAVPFVWLGDLVRPLYAHGIEANDAAIGYCLLLAAMCGSATVILLILIQLHLGISLPSAILCAASFGFGSLNWKYSAIFMNHVPAEFFVLAPLAFITAKKFWQSEVLQTLFLFFTGIMCVVRMELALLVPAYLCIYFLHRKIDATNTSTISVAKIIAYLGFGPLFVAFFNAVCFGAPWRTFTSFYAPGRNFWDIDPTLKVGGGFTLSEMLSHPIGEGLYKIFFQWPGAPPLSVPEAVAGLGAWGLFILQPVLLISVFGWFVFMRRNRTFATIVLGTIGLMVCFAAVNLSIDGGAMRDPRYVIPVLPLMFLPLGYSLDHAPGSARTFAFRFVFAFLSSLGFIACAIHFTDTASTIVSSVMQESVARESLISREGVGLIVESLLPTPTRGIVPLTISLIMALGIFFALKKTAEHFDKRKLSSVSNSSFLVLVFLDTLLIAGTAYASTVPINRLNHFTDTIRIGETPAHLAVQMSGLTRAYDRNISGITLKVGDRECNSGILISSPSSTRFSIPFSAKQLNTSVGVVESTRIAGPSDVSYEIWLDGTLAWSSPPLSQGAKRPEIQLPLYDAKTLELKTLSTNRNPELLSVWCDPNFK